MPEGRKRTLRSAPALDSEAGRGVSSPAFLHSPQRCRLNAP